MNTDTTFSEQNLVNSLKAKNQQAFAFLYDKYGSSMFGVIHTLVKDFSEAENLLQDSFIKIWKNIHLYNPDKGRLFTWLITICRNTALNFLRSRGKFSVTEIQNELTGVYTQRLTAEPVRQNYIGIDSAIYKLDDKHREVIMYIYFLGYTHQEAADQLKLPLGTVKTRTRNALRALKSQLEN